MATHPQAQCLFVAKLPPEIRDLVYLEIWRSYGSRQHLIRHFSNEDGSRGPHLCHWPCTTPFDVRDPLQDHLEATTRESDFAMGDGLKDRPSCRALQSPWLNHWKCGERAEQRYGDLPIWGRTTGGTECWKDGKYTDPAPYLSMLLSCKLISEECLSSIYRETTFVFTDPSAAQTITGYCDTAPRTKMENVPQSRVPRALLRFATSIEISLSANFAVLVPCTNARDRIAGTPHGIYDFHWLGLHKLESLTTLCVWIAARGASTRSTLDYEGEIYITQLDEGALKGLLAALDGIRSVIISAPLSPRIGNSNKDGYVQGLGVRTALWKRGCGDRFHPMLDPTAVAAMSGADEHIYSFLSREVRVARGLNSIGFNISPAA